MPAPRHPVKEKHHTMNRPVARRRIYAVAAGSLALGLALSACGGSSKSSTSATTTPTSTGGGKAAAGGAARRPTAVGPVTAVEASSMKVTSTQYGKVVVDWTATTDFSQTKTVTKADLTAGTCVTVVGSGSGSKVTARTVELSQPVSGKCTASSAFGGGFGGGFAGGGHFTGKRPSGTAGGSVPSGAPGGSVPSGAAKGGAGGRNFKGFAGGGDFYTGKVTSLSGNKLVISGSSGFGSKATTKTIDLTLASSTTYSETAKTTSKAVAVGDCVTASGTETSNTTMKASTVRITSTGGKSCTGGFAFGRRTSTNG